MVQNIIVLVIVAVAVVLCARRIIKTFSKDGIDCGCGCGKNCKNCSVKK